MDGQLLSETFVELTDTIVINHTISARHERLASVMFFSQLMGS